MLKLLGGLGSLGIAVLVTLLLLVAIFSVQLSGSTVGGGPCLPASTGTAGTGGCSGNGAVVAQAALAMAPHLYGTPDAWYDADMPQPVLTFWARVCPPRSGCWSDWQEGRLQCVLFVTGAYALSGSPLRAMPLTSGHCIRIVRGGWRFPRLQRLQHSEACLCQATSWCGTTLRRTSATWPLSWE